MERIPRSEIKTLARKLMKVDETASLGYVPPNVPSYGNPEDDVVNVNAIVDDNIEDAAEEAVELKKEPHGPDALYVETAIRMKIRRLIENG